jgi:DNA-binding CsgD family transcriptional regulator
MLDVEPQLLDMLYRGVTEAGGFGEALQSMMRMFGCSGAALVSVDPLTPASNLALTAGLLQQNAKLYEQFATVDPAPIMFSRLRVGTASATDRIFSAEELRGSVFLQEFLRPLNIVETLGGNLFADKDRFALIGLQRGSDRPEFDDDDIAQLGRVMPHIARAVQLRRTFENMTAMTHLAQAAIDRLHAGVMLLDRGGTALFVNAAMQAVVRRGDGFAFDRKGRPFPVDLTARRNLEKLLAGGGAGGTFVVPRTELGGSYTGIVAPVPPAFNDVAWDRRGRAQTLVIVHDPDTRSRNAVEILQQGLNLTKAAARLVEAIAADDDLQSFADREGITIHTARFHLRTALARTGATTQAELVRTAVRLLRDVAMRG